MTHTSDVPTPLVSPCYPWLWWTLSCLAGPGELPVTACTLVVLFFFLLATLLLSKPCSPVSDSLDRDLSLTLLVASGFHCQTLLNLSWGIPDSFIFPESISLPLSIVPTLYLYCPQSVMNVVKCEHEVFSPTEWYPFHASSMVFTLPSGTAVSCWKGKYVWWVCLKSC